MNYPFVGLELLPFIVAPFIICVVVGLLIEAVVRIRRGRE
jgi:hypothetical protein